MTDSASTDGETLAERSRRLVREAEERWTPISSPATEPVNDPALALLLQQIHVETTAWQRESLEDALPQLTFGTPGTRDYDWAIDNVRAVEQAVETLEVLRNVKAGVLHDLPEERPPGARKSVLWYAARALMRLPEANANQAARDAVMTALRTEYSYLVFSEKLSALDRDAGKYEPPEPPDPKRRAYSQRPLVERIAARDPEDKGLPCDISELAWGETSETYVAFLLDAIGFHLEDIEDDDNLGLDVRLEAIETLGKLGYKSAVPGLVDTMLNHDEDEVSREAARALGAIGDAGGAAALEAAMGGQDPGGRWEQAVYALARLNTPDTDDLIDKFVEWRLRVAPQLGEFPRAAEIRERELWDA